MDTTANSNSNSSKRKIVERGGGGGKSDYGSLENWETGKICVDEGGRLSRTGGGGGGDAGPAWNNPNPNNARDEDSHLMAQSREQLTMDMTKSENSIFKQSKGCYVSRPKGLGLLCLTILVAVGVGFITYHSASSNCASTLTESSPQTPEDPEHVKLEEKLQDVRLPTSIRPIYYKVELIPHVSEEKNFTIYGKVTIDILILEETPKITLHIKNITIKEDGVTVGEQVGSSPDTFENSNKLTVVKHEYDEPREFYNVSLSETLKEGKTYRLFIEYTALLSDNLAGFYRSSYKDLETNGTRWLGVTQFQPTDARRAFPCFDEPALKAEFEISIARKNSMTSISNMDINRQEPVQGMDDWTWDHYNKSVPMSTYLVAFVVSDFASRQSDRNLSKPVFSVWARKDAIDQVEYARDIGPRILTFFESYFNVPFPLPKQDMIALPDFNAGAMENWGLITYRETAMLYDANVSSDYNRQRIATVIAHELAHQWFGNLVTPSWWSDLWLNEGFASYVEYIGTDHVEPEVKILDQFVVEEVQNVFALDALDSSHPISVPVHHPDEINEIFDRISYGKGASIIRMMNHFLTENSFKNGLTNYLTKWKFNSTTQNNLWDSLTEQAYADKTLDSHVTVKNIMDTWTLQKGYPVIQVDRNYPGKHANFTQTKFQLIKNETMAKEYESYRWWIPISYASKTFNTDFKKTKPEFWITKNEKYNDHGIHVDKTDWLIVNVQQTGYYRVNYDTRNWQLIIDQLNRNHSAIHAVNRAQLLDDALNLARASLLPYDVAFNVTMYLKNDDEYLPWESFLNAFSYISTMLLRSPSFGLFKTYMRNLVDNQYKSVGFMQQDEDQLLKRFHRINIVQWACSMDNGDCVSQVKSLFASWMKTEEPDSSNPVPTNMRSFVYCAAIRNGGEKEWNFLWDRYGRSNVGSEKNTILRSLACTRETWILNRYLLWAITPGSGIRKQDGTSIISSVARNEIGSYLAFNFIRDKWVQIREHFPVGLFSIGGIISSISQRLTTPFELMELKNFKIRYHNDLGAAARSVDQAIERVQANIQWFSDNYKGIDEWLQKTTTLVEIESSTSPTV